MRERSTTTATPAAPLRLRALIGPYIDVFSIDVGAAATIGRASACDICLVNDTVSRRHATILGKSGAWFIVDDASAGGTFLNGIRLEPSTSAQVNHGDLVRIGPWTFRAEIGHDAQSPAGEAKVGTGSVLRTLDDLAEASRRIERIDTGAPGLAADRLRLLSGCLSRMHSSANEADLAEIALEHALKGTGFARGAVLLPADVPGEVTVVCTQGYGDEPPRFSRSLLNEAASGHAASLGFEASMVTSASIVDMQVRRAMCTPVLLSEVVCAFIYLDARRGEEAVPPDAGPFCEAVARAHGLALANLKRADLEHRQRELTAQLQSARSVQQTIAPAAAGRVAHIEYAVHVQPGVFVAGDLFDIIPLPDGVAVVLGDVSGHGVASGMLMAVTQAHLNAHLRSRGDVGEAVRSLNTYLCEHSAEGRFVSLWVGKVSADGHVRFIDAGHGHWHTQAGAGEAMKHSGRGAIPLGIDPDADFEEQAARLHPGDRLVLYSDGVLEQRNLSGEVFGLERLIAPRARGEPPDAFVQRVFEELRSFAARPQFDDDATIAIIEMLDG